MEMGAEDSCGWRVSFVHVLIFLVWDSGNKTPKYYNNTRSFFRKVNFS